MSLDGDRSRMLGRLLMAGAVLQLLLFLAGMSRRSYLVVALPVGAGLALVSALAFWVGYTMAYAKWDDDAPGESTADTLAGAHEASTAEPDEPEQSYGAGG